MKTWTIPVAVGQQFAANEYVSACLNVRCSVDGLKTGYTIVALDDNGNGVYDAGVDTALFDRGGKLARCCDGYHPVTLNGDMPLESNGVVVRGSDGENIPVYLWFGDAFDYVMPEGNTLADFHVTNLARADEFIIPADNPNFS